MSDPRTDPQGDRCPRRGADEASPRSGVSAFFVSDGPISSNSGRNGGKNAGRNCVSALPQRATPVRCRPRFPSRNRRFPDRCRSPDCASTAFRCRCLLLRQKLFVLPCRRLRNNYILCPTGTPTFAALRRQRRDLIIAHSSSAPAPTLAPRQRQRRKRYKRSPEPTTTPAAPIPRSQHRQICTCPPRAKGSLNRRFEWFSLVAFFLQKKKATRAGARNSPSPAPTGTALASPEAVPRRGQKSLTAAAAKHPRLIPAGGKAPPPAQKERTPCGVRSFLISRRQSRCRPRPARRARWCSACSARCCPAAAGWGSR